MIAMVTKAVDCPAPKSTLYRFDPTLTAPTGAEKSVPIEAVPVMVKTKENAEEVEGDREKMALNGVPEFSICIERPSIETETTGGSSLSVIVTVAVFDDGLMT